eukprot:8938350-Pyramimonas_sp.AAC.1
MAARASGDAREFQERRKEKCEKTRIINIRCVFTMFFACWGVLVYVVRKEVEEAFETAKSGLKEGGNEPRRASGQPAQWAPGE